MNVNSYYSQSKLYRFIRLLFAICIVMFFLLNALLLNLYSNIFFLERDSIHQTINTSLSCKRWPIAHFRSINQVDDNNDNNILLTTNDSTILLKMTNFRFLLNHPDKCRTNRVFMIIFVHSAVGNFEKRQVIRNSWAKEANYNNSFNRIRVVFLVGQVANSNISMQLNSENQQHEDIIQGNFVDTYRNMTYKYVMGLKWVSYYCLNAQYVFKTDDDIFVDLLQLVYYLRGTFGANPTDIIACYLNRNPWVKRSYRNKWRVSYKEYSDNYYPDYCSGWGIVMSPDVVVKLYQISRSRPYFWIDDVFISGLLAQDLKIHHVDLSERVFIDRSHIESWLQNPMLTLPPMFGVPDSDSSDILRLWNKTTLYYQAKFNFTFQ